LQLTDVELGLITNPNVYLMIESAIGGGLSYIAQRHAAANFPEMPDYRPDLPTAHLLYLDCNSLYRLIACCGRIPLFDETDRRRLCDTEIAKLIMYEFYYDCLLPKLGDRLHLCFTDTVTAELHLPRAE